MATGTIKTEIKLTRDELNQALIARYWPADSRVKPRIQLLNLDGNESYVTMVVLTAEEALFPATKKEPGNE